MGHQSIAEDFRLDRSIPSFASLPAAEGADPPGAECFALRREALLARPKRAEKAA